MRLGSMPSGIAFLQLQQSGFVGPGIMLSVSGDDLDAFCIALSLTVRIIV